jgi:hypothetical protein
VQPPAVLRTSTHLRILLFCASVEVSGGMQASLATGSSGVAPRPNTHTWTADTSQGTPVSGSGANVYTPQDHQEYAAPQSATVQADSDCDYVLALQLQQAEEEAARRYSPRYSSAAQPRVTQSTLQGAVLTPQSEGVPPVPVPVATHSSGVVVSGAPPVNDGPRRFSGARQSGPVYMDPNPTHGRHNIGGRGRPGSGRRPQTSDNCTVM